MIDKNYVENILRANGIAPTAKDEEIRSLLLSAKWTENDVDTALMVLKENITTKETHIDTLHKVFHTDQKLTPDEINSLLGIKATFNNFSVEQETHDSGVQSISTFIAIVLSILIALSSVGYVMYREQAGFFYPDTKVSNE